MVYLKSRNILANGTIRVNCLGGCSVDDNKPMSKISRWCKEDKVHKDIPCPGIVMQYNKSIPHVKQNVGMRRSPGI